MFFICKNYARRENVGGIWGRILKNGVAVKMLKQITRQKLKHPTTKFLILGLQIDAKTAGCHRRIIYKILLSLAFKKPMF